MMGISVYIFITTLPLILDVFLPLNETRSREHPFHMEFFIDEEKFFYLIRIQMYFIIVLIMGTVLANGTIFVVYTRHASGMFTILGYCAFFYTFLIFIKCDFSYINIAQHLI